MKGIMDLLKISYRYNKRVFILTLLVVAALVVLTGCATQGGSAPPSGPIGGGCG